MFRKAQKEESRQMVMLYMNTRCKRMLQILLSRSDYITVNQLAQELGVSRRTAYYDVCKVNLWLEQARLPTIEGVRERGLFLSHSQREYIRTLLKGENAQQVYIFSPEERVKLIICCIIYESHPVHIEHLIDCCEVSRNTIFNDLKEVERTLGQYELSLTYQAKSGYLIVGDEVRVRALFVLYFNEMETLFKQGTVKFFQQEQIQDYLERLESIQSELGVDYVEGVLLSIAALVPLMYQHKRLIQFSGLKEAEIMRTKEYALAQRYFSDLRAEEQIYLSLHLLGSRVNLVPEEFFESASKQYVYDLLKALITAFEKVACISFDNREELERALFMHLNTSLYRYQYGIQIGNVLGDDVMHEYPNLFALTRIAAKSLEESGGFPIPDSEIAYLVLHFGSFLKIGRGEHEHLRVLIVCVNGVSTGNMLKREVQRLLPFAEIVGVVAAMDMHNVQNVCDIVISTVQINCIVPVITVHPIMTEFDRRAILNHELVVPKNIEMQRDRIFAVVKKYVNPVEYDNLLQDLNAFVQGKNGEPKEDEIDNASLLRILDESRVQVFDRAPSWQECLRMTGKCLLDHHSVEPKYINTIINQLQYYGPYMFLTEDVILAHAKPEDGVICLDVALAVFREPAVFSVSRKAKLVILLAAEDQEKHLGILQEILLLVSDPSSIERLHDCAGSAEALSYIRALLCKRAAEENLL
jgi:transcriptional antiterminator/mannitol/fructose-specific phosphotransferase system IIA component (Ntr-type)